MNIRFALLRRPVVRASLRDQRGSMLVEVMIGALLLAACSAAMLDGLGGAQDTGQRNKARSVSASLSQQDQERMRAMPIEDLSNYRRTWSTTVANAPYTVVSRADWVRDSSGVVSCTNDSTQAQYLKITSTTTSNVQQNPPVTMTSLVAPPRGAFSTTDGTAAVQVVDRDQNPIAGVRVDIDGPQNLTDTTNDLGCVVFGFIPEGPWDIEVDSLGLVGTDGTHPFQTDIGVVGGTTVLKQIQLDEPSSITATFKTRVGALESPAQAKSISVNNALLASPGWKTKTAATPQDSLTVDSLFPFADGYGVYAGTCADNNPTKWDSDYFTTTGSQAFVVPTPGSNATASVLLPSIKVVVLNSNGSPRPNARVFVKPQDTTNCTESYAQMTTDVAGVAQGAFPWGRFRVCADDGANRSARINTSPWVSNTNPDGVVVNLTLPSGTNSNCNLATL